MTSHTTMRGVTVYLSNRGGGLEKQVVFFAPRLKDEQRVIKGVTPESSEVRGWHRVLHRHKTIGRSGFYFR